jgi:hypothetical protein
VILPFSGDFMPTKTSVLLRANSIFLVCLMFVACGSTESSPTAPTTIAPDAIADPGPDDELGSLEVEVTPNPVPWSSATISESGCGDVLNIWV